MNYISCNAVCLRRTGTPAQPSTSLGTRDTPTLSFLSLQFRQPNLDLRRGLRPRTSLGQVEVILCAQFVREGLSRVWKMNRRFKEPIANLVSETPLAISRMQRPLIGCGVLYMSLQRASA